MKTYFKNIKVNQAFYYNGNLCIKRSTRTAILTEYNRVFYFGQNDVVKVVL